MKKMLKYLKGYEKECVIAPLFKMLEALFDLFVPLVMVKIIDVGIAQNDKSYISSRCFLLVGIAFLGLACSLIAQYYASKAAVGYASHLRHSLFKHIQTLGFSEIDTVGSSTLITRMTSDINQVQTGINLFLRLFLRSPFILFGSVIMAFTISVKGALVFVAAVPLLSIVVVGIMVRTMPIYKKVQHRLDRVLGKTRENLTGVRVIRAFGREQAEVDSFKAANSQYTKLQLFVGRISALTNPITFIIIELAVVAILYTGARSVNGGVLLQGDIIALVSYMSQILVELIKLANLVIQLTKSLSSAGRISDVFATVPAMKYSASDIGISNNYTDAVQFDNVSFSYPEAGRDSLKSICFTARKGETIGIIGGTGSGKSTLVNLIPRFYDATQGTVYMFDRPVSQYSKSELRQAVGVVMQRAQLFKGTIRSNLLWGQPDANDAQLWEALEAAQAASFVREKPGGLDEPCEQDGRNFSGGQRQRLTIARALVSKPRILILDDSASALDFATDAALRRSIAAMSGDMTVFIVSQRTASILHADKIIVLEDGEQVGIGTHSELLANCPVYKEIYSSQFREEGYPA